MIYLFVFLLISTAGIYSKETDDSQKTSKTSTTPNILVFTVATNQTDGFLRYQRSAHTFHIEPTVLGSGKQWKGGAILRGPGGGWKLNLLRDALKPHRHDQSLIVLFTDAYDVMFLGDLATIVARFEKTAARVLFGAEVSCWPDSSLASKYPEIADGIDGRKGEIQGGEGSKFLNSGLFIGYADTLWTLLNTAETGDNDNNVINDTDDDQLYFTLRYLDEALRSRLHLKLDHHSEIFQNLYGVVGDVELIEDGDAKENDFHFKLKNTRSQTYPLIVHGNGLAKTSLNHLSNYLLDAWSPLSAGSGAGGGGCVECLERHVFLEKKKVDDLPVVVVGVFVEVATPFIQEFLEKVFGLDYPKSRIHLFVHNTIEYHSESIKEFIEYSQYSSVKKLDFDSGVPEATARDLSLDYCLMKNCDFYFAIDSIAHLDNPFTLRLLIEQNRTVVAPLLVRPGNTWSNFWGALSRDGFYARSNDYMDIVNNEKRGLWNVPYIANAYLINATVLRAYDRSQLNHHATPINSHQQIDPDMALCANLRSLDIFLYVSNRIDFGHLINPETFDPVHQAPHPDMYQIFENERDWAERYIHPAYYEQFETDVKRVDQPCPDVYRFPVVTASFTSHLIDMMEAYGKWSDGSNDDARLEGGYEAVPTRDIHMNQVGWERHWLHFLHRFVRPLQEYVFTGYFHDPPKSLMNFVVRYKPDEQPFLRPHHDSSTYTINIALNEQGVDYEGGGCRFIRYNCTVKDTKPGWMLMHPGRLTHYHEGLLVTKGVRYIMISFVDP